MAQLDRSTQGAVNKDLKPECDLPIQSHQRLRSHDRKICKRSEPLSEVCNLTKVCRFYQANRRQAK